MNFNVLIGLLLVASCSGEPPNPAVSSLSFHREDVPTSYGYNTVHLNDNSNAIKDLSGLRSESQHQLRPQQGIYKNIQYAPLVLKPNEQEAFVIHTTTTAPDTELIKVPEMEVTPINNNIEPQFAKQHSENVNVNGQVIQLKYVAGHNIKVEPKTNKIIYKGDQQHLGENNYGFPDRNAWVQDRSSIQRYYLNNIPEPRQETTTFPRYTQVTEMNTIEHYQQKPINDIKTLSRLESAKIHPVFNPYIKVPRLHLNVARAYKISHGEYKTPNNNHPKFLISKPKRNEVLLEQKSFIN